MKKTLFSEEQREMLGISYWFLNQMHDDTENDAGQKQRDILDFLTTLFEDAIEPEDMIEMLRGFSAEYGIA